jgi:hypothetical protein
MPHTPHTIITTTYNSSLLCLSLYTNDKHHLTLPHRLQLLASGNTAGRVYVTHYPCQDRAGFADSLAHAGPVPRVAWGAGDVYVVSVGQKDHAVMKWRAVYDDARDSGDEGGMSCEDSEVERDGGHEFTDGEIVRHTPLRQGPSLHAPMSPRY